MTTVVLNKEDLDEIKKFMQAFSASSVEIEADDSSGIGSVVTVHAHVSLNGRFVRVSQVISDESSW